MIMMLVMSAAVLSLGAACLHLQRKVKEQSEVLTKTETLYNDVRREKNRLIIEKAEIEKNSFTLEQINAGLMADNARLKAERDAALSQQEETENVEIAAEPERGDLLPLPAAPTEQEGRKVVETVSEFINRKLFIAATQSLHCETCNHRIDCLICNVGRMIRKIKNFPSADVAPVVHGHWKYADDDDVYTCYKCSACGSTLAGDKSRYCPGCGAKMDESEGKQ